DVWQPILTMATSVMTSRRTTLRIDSVIIFVFGLWLLVRSMEQGKFLCAIFRFLYLFVYRHLRTLSPERSRHRTAASRLDFVAHPLTCLLQTVLRRFIGFLETVFD